MTPLEILVWFLVSSYAATFLALVVLQLWLEKKHHDLSSRIREIRHMPVPMPVMEGHIKNAQRNFDESTESVRRWKEFLLSMLPFVRG